MSTIVHLRSLIFKREIFIYRCLSRWAISATFVVAFLILAALARPCAAAESFTLKDAGEAGPLHINGAGGSARVAEDANSGRSFIKIDYRLPPGAIGGAWTKGYPEGLNAGTVDLVGVSMRSTDAASLRGVSASVEIKGVNGIQVLEFSDKEDLLERLDWGTLQELREAVFLLKSASGQTVSGQVRFALEFRALSASEKLGASLGGKMGGVICLALAAALLAALIQAFTRGALSRGGGDLVQEPKAFSALLRDLALGASAVLLAGSTLAVYSLGSASVLEAGSIFLAASALGVLVAFLLKLAMSGRALSPAEAFRDALFSGLLAASASKQVVWQAPQAWSHFFLLSGFGAATFFLLYHLANAGRLSASKKHLSAVGGGIIVAVPYAFGLLLALQSAPLKAALGSAFGAGHLSGSADFVRGIGGVLFLFGFNEFLANGFSLLRRGRFLKSAMVHFYLLAFAAATILAPAVADLGSGAWAAGSPAFARPFIAVIAAMLSQGALWAEVFMLTGMVIEGMRGESPSMRSVLRNALSGMRKGVVYSGILMGILQILGVTTTYGSIPMGFLQVLAVQSNIQVLISLSQALPILLLVPAIALIFPLCKTIIETFDGSHSFFGRAAKSYRNPFLFFRGAIVGIAIVIGLSLNFPSLPTAYRIYFGFAAGALAFGGVSFLRDAIYGLRGCGHVKTWRLYLVEAGLGAFIGGGLGFYLDAAQVPMVLDKFRLYVSFGLKAHADDFYTLVSKWGRIELATYEGGAKLLFNESLKGVIGWGVAAWLFALNRAFLEALFRRTFWPIKRAFSRDGIADLTENTIHVMRWGLWMAPIIFTFLRQMSEPTWYNQDGAIRTISATVHAIAMDTESFRQWSLHVFLGVLAYDLFRILIWLDHMGLRVATLVNLSFIGMDRLDDRFARFIGPAATGRFIPEGVKRFATWAPLLIPFYLPRGADWDYVWGRAETIQAASSGGMLGRFSELPFMQQVIIALTALIGATLIFALLRFLRERRASHTESGFRLSNNNYEVELKESGEIGSRLITEGFDLTRRAYEGIDPAGRILFLIDADKNEKGAPCAWPVAGNYPTELFPASRAEFDGSVLTLTNEHNGVRAIIKVSLPSDRDVAAEIWDVEIENLSDEKRDLKIAPYLEWVLNTPASDRGHTQYNRLYPEMEYDAENNAILALHRYTKKYGILAADRAPEGFLTSRMDFIGRAGNVWKPGALETLDFLSPFKTKAYPTFDPIASLLLGVSLEPRGKNKVRFMIGCADEREVAASWIQKILKPKVDKTLLGSSQGERKPLIGHGAIPPGTPQPYYEFLDNGDRLRVLTPFTPRPYDHTMSNAGGHVLCVTNRGLHTSSSVNAQQNRLTTDWADTVGAQLPSEIFYLYDIDRASWYSPTWHPLNDPDAEHIAEFGVDGTATFRMTKDELCVELTTFVPPNDPVGIYVLKVKNTGGSARRLRVAPYFQMALAQNPEDAKALRVDRGSDGEALFFQNRNNDFRSGPAFVAMTRSAECVATKRGEFLGQGRSIAHPLMVEQGAPADNGSDDRFAVGAFLTTLEIPSGGEESLAVILGQTERRAEAKEVIAKFQSVESALSALDETRRWWKGLTSTLQVKTSDPEFDGYLNWLKYQSLSERIWARKGFYQASGAFGFRDQLQDTVNLIWVDPALARRQILLHAAQQFLEGDVTHWFFTLQDGRTGFAQRSYASDNPLWLGWGATEYVRMTGDTSILDEKVSYLTAETPLSPLPEGKHGMGFIAHRSPIEGTLLDHVLLAVDMVFERRLGAHGLPLILTGDWNDGLDEIGSEGRGESVWLGFFLTCFLNNLLDQIEERKGEARRSHYENKLAQLKDSIEGLWREDRYLRAIHDDGTEIGVKGSGIWEIDALTAAWAVMSGINKERGRIVFDTALRELEKDNVVLLGSPPLREDSKPYLGRSCRYPEGVRENGMYCHGVQWLIKAARILSEDFAREGDAETASHYRDATIRLWRKISAVGHMAPGEIEMYGGQPNKQAADLVTTFDQGRMIWNGYTGAAAWLLRQAVEGVLGFNLDGGRLTEPEDLDTPRGDLIYNKLSRDISVSPLPTIEDPEPQNGETLSK